MLAREATQFEEAQGEYTALDTEISAKSKTAQPKGEIRIPLPKKYSAKAISGDSGIIDSVTRMFCVVDRLVTSVRVSEVFESFATGDSGVGTIHTGLSNDVILSTLYYIGLGGIALLDEHITRVERRRKDTEKQNIYKLLFKNPALENKDEPIPDDALETMTQMRWEQIVNNMNYYLNQERIADKALKEKYSAIFIDAKTNAFVLQRHASATKEPEILKSKVLGSIWEYGVKPFYRAGGFAGFAFWLMWMAATATTGIQMEGIYGMAPWVAVGVPAGFGLMHLGLYYYNAWKYGGFEKARQHAEAVADFDVLLKTLKQREHDYEMEYLHKRKNELDAEFGKRGLVFTSALKPEGKKLMIQVSNEKPWAKAKGTLTGFTVSAGAWGGANSYSWYIKVLIETAYASVLPAVLSAPLIGTVVGGVTLGLACLSGFYNGYNRYKEAKASKDASLQALSEKYDLVVIPKNSKILHPVQNKIYLQEIDGQIAYTLHTFDNKIVRGCVIEKLKAPQPFDIDNVSNLKKQILEATLKAGHTAKPSIPLEDFEKHYNSRLEYLEKLKAEMQIYKNTITNKDSNHYVNIPKTFDTSVKKLEDEKPEGRFDTFMQKCLPEATFNSFVKYRTKFYDASIAFRHHPRVRPWIDALDLNLVGIFVGRVIFTSAAPFLLAPLLPVVLTGPIGIAAIAAVGLAFFALKWYENCQLKKEQRAKELPGMLDTLEKNIEDAELTINDMRKSQILINHDVICETQKPIIDKCAKQGRQYSPTRLLGKYFGTPGVSVKASDDKKSDVPRSDGSIEVDGRKEFKSVFAC